MSPPQATSSVIRGLHSSVAFLASDSPSKPFRVVWALGAFVLLFSGLFYSHLGKKKEKRKDLGTVPCWEQSPCWVQLPSWWVCLDALLCLVTMMVSGVCPGQARGREPIGFHFSSVQWGWHSLGSAVRLQGSAVLTWAADSPLTLPRPHSWGPQEHTTCGAGDGVAFGSGE